MKNKTSLLLSVILMLALLLTSCSSLSKDKNDKNDSTKDEENCVHYWINGEIDTECETTRDAVLRVECRFCRKKVETDIRTTITEEEYLSAFSLEHLYPNFTAVRFILDEYTVDDRWDETETSYSVCDENGWYVYEYDEYGSYSTQEWILEEIEEVNDYEGTSYITYEDSYRFLPSFEELVYDEERKCYVGTKQINYEEITFELYFNEGRILAVTEIWEEDGKMYGCTEMLLDVGNSNSTARINQLSQQCADALQYKSYKDVKSFTYSTESGVEFTPKEELTLEQMKEIIEYATSCTFERYLIEDGIEEYTIWDTENMPSVAFFDEFSHAPKRVTVGLQNGKVLYALLRMGDRDTIVTFNYE